MKGQAMSDRIEQIRRWEAGELYPDHETFSFGHGFGLALAEDFDRLNADDEGLRVEIDRLRAYADEVHAKHMSALVALSKIAQYDPRWTGQRVNDEPSRQKIIEIAYDALVLGGDERRADGDG